MWQNDCHDVWPFLWMCWIVSLSAEPRNNCQARQKVAPFMNFANYSRTIERYDIKFYTLVTNLLSCKSGQSLHYPQN